MDEDKKKKLVDNFNEKRQGVEDSLIEVMNPDRWFGWLDRRRDRRRHKEGEIAYAGFNDRTFASAIDLVLLLAIFWMYIPVLPHLMFSGDALREAIGTMNGQPASTGVVFSALASSGYFQLLIMESLLISVLFAPIFILLWSNASMTPGKWLLRMRVVDRETGKRPTRKQCFKRYLGYMLCSLPMMLGFLSVMFNDKKQGWHDKIADTVVIKVKHWRMTPPDVSEYPSDEDEEMGEEEAEDDVSEAEESVTTTEDTGKDDKTT